MGAHARCARSHPIRKLHCCLLRRARCSDDQFYTRSGLVNPRGHRRRPSDRTAVVFRSKSDDHTIVRPYPDRIEAGADGAENESVGRGRVERRRSRANLPPVPIAIRPATGRGMIKRNVRPYPGRLLVGLRSMPAGNRLASAADPRHW